MALCWHLSPPIPPMESGAAPTAGASPTQPTPAVTASGAPLMITAAKFGHPPQPSGLLPQVTHTASTIPATRNIHPTLQGTTPAAMRTTPLAMSQATRVIHMDCHLVIHRVTLMDIQAAILMVPLGLVVILDTPVLGTGTKNPFRGCPVEYKIHLNRHVPYSCYHVGIQPKDLQILFFHL